ncbi:ATP-dependent zinc protease family protein [Glaciecola sp. 1036]|uniref:ATP-dependent zinc protease family protein n=1 Tax=Alteromonadaceae TaxID=72275 RepID=UPI003D08593C
MSEKNLALDDALIIGAIETIDLPDLGLAAITTRIDTGAQTSALHVDHIQLKDRGGIIEFEFHPDFHEVKKTIKCSAQLHDTRWVKSSNGERERRYVIKTTATLGVKTWEIELTLTNRSGMNHLMLLGREAMQDGFLVHPGESFLAS